MAIVKRPPESVNRSLSLEKPVSELLDNYCKFVDCTPATPRTSLYERRSRAIPSTGSGKHRRTALGQCQSRV
jgi:hypothetical protein